MSIYNEFDEEYDDEKIKLRWEEINNFRCKDPLPYLIQYNAVQHYIGTEVKKINIKLVKKLKSILNDDDFEKQSVKQKNLQLQKIFYKNNDMYPPLVRKSLEALGLTDRIIILMGLWHRNNLIKADMKICGYLYSELEYRLKENDISKNDLIFLIITIIQNNILILVLDAGNIYFQEIFLKMKKIYNYGKYHVDMEGYFIKREEIIER